METTREIINMRCFSWCLMRISAGIWTIISRRTVTNPARDLKDDEDFIESNKMHGINGFLYGNLPGLSICQGNKIHWHLFGLGNEVDTHSVHFHGQILTAQNRHTDTVSLSPGSSTTAEMVADNVGHWLLTCTVNDHLMAGMQALFEIKKCFPNVHKPRPHGEHRTFFIAAEEEVWDYAPTPTDDEEAEAFLTRGKNRIGSRYKKVRYVEYSDNTFMTKMLRTPEELHLGILGPVIRAEEKDTISVVFKNKASRPYSMQPHGVQYSVEQDGTLYFNELEESYTEKRLRELKKQPRVVTPLPAALVKPGSVYTYEWTVPIGAGPVQGEADCLTYLYYSAVDPVKDTSSGLVGPLLVCRPGSLKKGVQKHYDKEFHLLATVFDENLSWYLDENILTFTSAPTTVNKEDEDFIESNKMHAINGFVFRSLPGLTMCKGNKVTWHLSGLGSESDINSLYFQGNRFIYLQNRRDSINVFPHISHTVTMEPDSMGQFEVVSPTVSNYRGGMRANYTVEKCGLFQRQSEIMLHSKTYYIAAVEIEWDYSPSRIWETENFRGQESPGSVFLDKQAGFIGSRYKKVVYRQFTSDKFTKQVERTADTEHLGIMGLMIHANVGDKVKVVFKNMASRPYSIHANGVKTDTPDVYHTKPAINGQMYGNLDGLNMEVGDKVYWYLMGMGTDVDIHSVHWHGHSAEYKLGGGPHRTDVYELFPATFQTLKMRPQYPGTWLLHCHVTDHIKAGMITTYTVTEKDVASTTCTTTCTTSVPTDLPHDLVS
ncbi:hypothetical protein fugu_006417 [Takifugu bimaculatus]|uniref:ferroxidase n=1 Tax=Takifugu bimaculatus TaxID=433685 RepID=A0A4Z2B9H6_9TELE|nr:hypothetical protein fugu_006417 [Takifugu bimaculatus]